MRKSSLYMAVMIAAVSSAVGEPVAQAAPQKPRDRDTRTPDDISARQRKRQAKLARRAAKHEAEQGGE